MASVTSEQIETAKSIDLLSYLQRYEPHSIRKSGANEYCLKEHDSLKISNGRWNWFSRGFGGYSALDFLIKVRGIEFVEAVKHLTDGGYVQTYAPPDAKKAKLPKPFTLPPANSNNDKVIAYLRGRGIDSKIIKPCIENGTLYESAKSHNCVFVGFDGITPRFACERGTSDSYKKDVSGSDKRFSFYLPPLNKESRNLAVYHEGKQIAIHRTSYQKKDMVVNPVHYKSHDKRMNEQIVNHFCAMLGNRYHERPQMVLNPKILYCAQWDSLKPFTKMVLSFTKYLLVRLSCYKSMTIKQSFNIENTLLEHDNVIDFPIKPPDLGLCDEVAHD